MQAHGDALRSNGHKLECGKFSLDTFFNLLGFFTIRVVKYWNRGPEKLWDHPSLEMLETWLDEALI